MSLKFLAGATGNRILKENTKCKHICILVSRIIQHLDMQYCAYYGIFRWYFCPCRNLTVTIYLHKKVIHCEQHDVGAGSQILILCQEPQMLLTTEPLTWYLDAPHHPLHSFMSPSSCPYTRAIWKQLKSNLHRLQELWAGNGMRC